MRGGTLRSEGPAFLAALLLLYLVQLSVAGWTALWGVTPALIPLGVTLAGAWKGPAYGGVFGVAAGLIWLTQVPGYPGMVLPGLCLLGLLGGLLRPGAPGFGLALLRAAAGMLLWEAGRLLLHLLGEGAAVGGLAVLAGREWLWSLPYLALLYPLFWVIYRKREKGVCHDRPAT